MKPIKKISLCGLVSLGLLSSAGFLNTNAVTPEKLNPTKIQFAIPSMYKHTFPLEKLGWKPIIVHLDEQPNGDVYAIVPQRSPHNSLITSTQIIHLIGKPIPSSMGGVICNGYKLRRCGARGVRSGGWRRCSGRGLSPRRRRWLQPR